MIPAGGAVTHLAAEDGAFVLSRDGLELAWRGGRELAAGGDVPRVLKSGPQSATLHVPGKPPLALTGADQIRIFERLVEASMAGSPDVQVKQLMDGLGSRSPQQAFRPKTWESILNVYIASRLALQARIDDIGRKPIENLS